MIPYTKKKPFSGLTPYSRPVDDSFLLMEDGFYLLQENGGRIIIAEATRLSRLTPYDKQEKYQSREEHNNFNPYQNTNKFRRINPYGQKNITTQRITRSTK